MKMSEMNSNSWHGHRPPHLIFCEEGNGKGGEDDHEDEISNSLTSIDDREPRPNKTINEHNNNNSDDDDDVDDRHNRNCNQSSHRKEDDKRTDDDDDDDAHNVDNSKKHHIDDKPGSTATETLSSDLKHHGVDAVTEQMSGGIDAPAMMTSISTPTSKLAAIAISTNDVIPTVSTTEVAPRLATIDDESRNIMERNELAAIHVGRVIGKGGEMIRDLQARSGCRIDVDQNVTDPNAPRHITYHGQNQEDIDFAKRLVSMVCQSNMLDDGEQHLHHQPIELPLGKAVRRYIHVHKSVVGRIIGRGGDMIRDLQIKSHARIQVDHKGEYSASVGGSEEKSPPSTTATTSSDELQFRQVMITGTEESVQRAEEMILQLSNRHYDEFDSQQQQHHRDQEQHTFIDTRIVPSWDRREFGAGVLSPTFDSISGYSDVASPPLSPMQQRSFPMSAWNANRYPSNPPFLTTTTTIIETEIIPCANENIGHVIGRRGVTVNDLQWRSGCNIQIDRRGCKISISGSRQGIELAKNMISNIFEHGPTHMYAGGRQRQFDVQEPEVPPRELVQPVSFQSFADLYPGGSLQTYSQPPSYLYRPMMPQQQQYYPRLPQPMVMFGQLPQRQVFPPQQLLQPPIQDTSPDAQSLSAAAASSSVWREAMTIDGRMYYYNTDTMETRWDRPE